MKNNASWLIIFIFSTNFLQAHVYEELVQSLTLQPKKKELTFSKKDLSFEFENYANDCHTQSTINKIQAYIKSELPDQISINEALSTRVQSLLNLKGFIKSRVKIHPKAPTKILIYLEKKYAINSVKIECPEEIHKKLDYIWQNNKNKPFSVKKLESKKSSTLDVLKKNGYPEAKIIIKVLNNKCIGAKTLLNLGISFELGPNFRFGQIKFNGSTISPESLNELLIFKPGDPFNARTLYKAKQAFQKTGIFNKVACKYNMKELGQVDDKKIIPIEFDLEEESKTEIKLNFGFLINSLKNQKYPFNLKMESSFSRNSVVLPYDSLKLSMGVELQSRYMKLNHSFGKLKNFPVETNSSLFIESNNKLMGNRKVDYRLFSINNSLLKELNDRASIKLLSGYQSVFVRKEGSNDYSNFEYLICEPEFAFKNFNRESNSPGFLLRCADAWMIGLNQANLANSLRVSLETFLPINYSYSIVSKFGFLINNSFFPKRHEAQLKNHEYLKSLSDEEPIMFDEALTNMRKEGVLDFYYFNNYLNATRKNCYFALETQKRISNILSTSVFWNFCLKDFLHPNFIAGAGIQANTFFGGLAFNLGWNFNTKKFLIRFNIADDYF